LQALGQLGIRGETGGADCVGLKLVVSTVQVRLLFYSSLELIVVKKKEAREVTLGIWEYDSSSQIS